MEYRRINNSLVKKSAEEWKAYDEANKPEPSAEEQIASLIKELEAKDYETIKYAQGLLTEEEFDIVKAECEAIRVAIRGLR